MPDLGSERIELVGERPARASCNKILSDEQGASAIMQTCKHQCTTLEGTQVAKSCAVGLLSKGRRGASSIDNKTVI